MSGAGNSSGVGWRSSTGGFVPHVPTPLQPAERPPYDEQPHYIVTVDTLYLLEHSTDIESHSFKRHKKSRHKFPVHKNAMLKKPIETFGNVLQDPTSLLDAEERAHLKTNAGRRQLAQGGKLGPAMMLLSEEELAEFNEHFGAAIIGEPVLDTYHDMISAQNVAGPIAQQPYLPNIDRVDQSPNDGQIQRDPNGGAGTRGYIADSGLRENLKAEFDNRIVASICFTGETGEPLVDHGTHVASIAAGNTYGIAPGMDLIIVRIIDNTGHAPYSTVIAGMNWIAADHKARQAQEKKANLKPKKGLANFSLAGMYDAALEIASAYSNLGASDVLTTVAAGNYKSFITSYAPAGVIDPTGCSLVVGGVDPFDMSIYAASDFSKPGANPRVAIWQPSVNILAAISADASGQPIAGMKSGTSMGAPAGMGAAALYRANSDASAAQVAKQLATFSSVLPLAVIDYDCAGQIPDQDQPAHMLQMPRLPLEAISLTPGTLPHTQPSSLKFSPVKFDQDQLAGFSFHADFPHGQSTGPVQLTLTTAALYGSFQQYKDTSVMCRMPFDAAVQALDSVKNTGDFWVKYYQVDGKLQLDVGTGTEIDQNKLNTYNLGSYMNPSGGFSSKQPMIHFGFMCRPGAVCNGITFSNFKGYGNLVSSGATIPPHSAAPTMSTTSAPTNVATKPKTIAPTQPITSAPTNQSRQPTKKPTKYRVTLAPSDAPTTSVPSQHPTFNPTTYPTRLVTSPPTKKNKRTAQPTSTPSTTPTVKQEYEYEQGEYEGDESKSPSAAPTASDIERKVPPRSGQCFNVLLPPERQATGQISFYINTLNTNDHRAKVTFTQNAIYYTGTAADGTPLSKLTRPLDPVPSSILGYQIFANRIVVRTPDGNQQINIPTEVNNGYLDIEIPNVYKATVDDVHQCITGRALENADANITGTMDLADISKQNMAALPAKGNVNLAELPGSADNTTAAGIAAVGAAAVILAGYGSYKAVKKFSKQNVPTEEKVQALPGFVADEDVAYRFWIDAEKDAKMLQNPLPTAGPNV